MLHAKTVRLAERLHKDALRYAGTEGISLNALIAVSLRDYLDRKRVAAAIKGPVKMVEVVPLASDFAAKVAAGRGLTVRILPMKEGG